MQDIRNVLTRRWPSVQLLLCPVTVQGFEAAQQVADAIRKLDQRKEVDEIIVARGGGSREDLWVFNAEVIARAAYRCKKPLISAIGHEIDYSRPESPYTFRCGRACRAGSGRAETDITGFAAKYS